MTLRGVGLRLSAGLALAAGLLQVGCGGGAPSQTEARDQATAYACDYYQRCGMIAAGQTYTSRDDCETKIRATFQTTWPPEECSKISSTGFDNCLSAIRIADCNNPADVANVIFNKCTKMNVCGTP